MATLFCKRHFANSKLLRLCSVVRQRHFNRSPNFTCFQLSQLTFRPVPLIVNQSIPLRHYSVTSSVIDKKSSPTISVSCDGPFAGISLDILHNLEFYRASVVKEYTELSEQLSQSGSNNLSSDVIVAATKRWRELSAVGDILLDMEKLKLSQQETDSLIKELTGNEDSSDLGELAEMETLQRQKEQLELEKRLFGYLVPQEDYDDCDICLDIESGAGGQEAMLFADELLSMYMKYAELKGWTYTVNNTERSENLGGIRSASIVFQGGDIFSQLKYEGGVHRVQRVPVNGKGKIHTSTVAVAVLPMIENSDFEIDANELKWETFRSQGPGGQHVNKTDSAVRVTHLPTNIVAACQDDRSQHTNKNKALELLKQKIRRKRIEKQLNEESQNRRIQIGGRDRSEKIRTYNFAQDRVTDHRISKSWFGIERFMVHSKGFSELVEHLQYSGSIDRLEEVLTNYKNNHVVK